ncbi:metallophosphoesterase family protein [Breznakiella homolactica]|uniref:Metallophosphoesterase n=1 Tax=Breznakiella homolactica TaxID=2798577 RepID=A0A7T7XL01_9SPIR|nr:metallophosphoesterase [Breznakiella homolactica]QQO08137.1 metallophosphoesterase [Breznakiella homolactica]
MDELRLVLFGDTHIGPNSECRPGDEVEGLMRQFTDIVNTEIKPDLVIDLGDRVNNRDHDSDKKNLEIIAAVLRNLTVPCAHIFGNHDIHYLTKEENESILNSELKYRSSTVKGFELIFLDTADPIVEFIGGDVSGSQLQWLRGTLQKNDKPKLVFGHHPIETQNLAGNPHFTAFPHLAALRDGGRISELLKQTNSVIAYISAHVHWFYFLTRGPLHFISVPSFVEAYPLNKNAPGMYAELTVTGDGAVTTVVKSINPKRVLGYYEAK